VRKSTSVVRDALGKPQWAIALVEDVSARKRAEEALRESEERFRSVFDHAAVGIGRVALDGRFLEVNEAYAAIVGYTREELLGLRFQDITYRDDIKADVEELAALLAGRIPSYHLEKRYVRGDGNLVWVSLSVGLARDALGRPAYCSVVVEDITARKRAEDALRESEELFRLLVQGVRDCAIYMLAPDGTVTSWSVAAEQMFGYREEEIVGHHREVFFTDEQRESGRPQKELEEALATGHSEEEAWRVRKDGSRFWANVLITALDDHAGRLRGFANVTRDFTERKRAEEELRESEKKLRLAKDAAKMGAWNWDLLSNEMMWSDRCKTLFGLSPDTVMTWPVIMAAIHPEDRGRIDRAVNDALAKKQPYDVEMRVLRPDATVGWVASKGEVAYAADGRAVRMDGMAMDITARKHAEELARDANEKLREADRQKNRFLAMLSHELRNPLAPIRNSLYILKRAAPGGEQAKRAQAIIHRQVGQMTWLIDDLLDVTRIAHGKIQLQRERLDLNELAHRTVEDQRPVFAKSDVRLEVLPAPAEVWVNGDRVRLAQIISNLLQNAAKFTPHGGKTTVSVQADAARGLAILTVRDTGSGIEPEMLPQLFHPFTQADATLDRSKGGLGLGLALVKGLVEMHGGSVRAASDGLGKGAAFTISLPLDVTVARAIPAQRDLAAAAAPRRVLVIEDNEDAADTLREVLEFSDHVVEVAYSGRDGIDKARSFHPDVVLCDIGLPEMDGYQVARTMRADPELGRIALVAVSGYAQPEDVETAREAGFDAHLAKPPSIDTLERALAEVGNTRPPSGG